MIRDAGPPVPSRSAAPPCLRPAFERAFRGFRERRHGGALPLGDSAARLDRLSTLPRLLASIAQGEPRVAAESYIVPPPAALDSENPGRRAGRHDRQQETLTVREPLALPGFDRCCIFGWLSMLPSFTPRPERWYPTAREDMYSGL